MGSRSSFSSSPLLFLPHKSEHMANLQPPLVVHVSRQRIRKQPFPHRGENLPFQPLLVALRRQSTAHKITGPEEQVRSSHWAVIWAGNGRDLAVKHTWKYSDIPAEGAPFSPLWECIPPRGSERQLLQNRVAEAPDGASRRYAPPFGLPLRGVSQPLRGTNLQTPDKIPAEGKVCQVLGPTPAPSV